MPKGSRDTITRQGIKNLYSKGAGSVADAAGRRMGQDPGLQLEGIAARKMITNPAKKAKKGMFK